MQPKQFSKGEALRFGWDTMRSHLGFFIGVLVVVGLIHIAPYFFSAGIKEQSRLASFFFQLALWVLNVVVTIGLVKIALLFSDNEEAAFGDLVSHYRLFFKYFFASLLYGLIVAAGVILLIVPGIIWSLKFWFFECLVVDKGLGPIEALKRSSSITSGVKWDLFVFSLLVIAINLLGAACLLIGLFATIPTTWVAMAFVYRKLLAQTEPLRMSETATDETND